MTTIIDGSAGITFPNSTVQASAGKVLQVVQGTYNTTTSTSSNSFVTLGLTASITPKFSTSKILITVNGGTIDNSAANGQGSTTIYRNSTNLGNSTYGLSNYYGASRIICPMSMSYLDSPSTTSSTTYSVYFNVQTGTLVFNPGAISSVATITLMEIAG